MKHAIRIVMSLYFVFSAGCGSRWTTTESKFFKYQNKDVRVAAKIMMNEKAKPDSSGGVGFAMRLFTKDYGTVLTEIEQTVGEGLESSGSVHVPEVVTIAITEFRLGGTPNTYQDFCAEIRMDNSNIPDWRKLGCVNFVDTPSESPTGGIQ